MSELIQTQLHEFAAKLLERRGGLVDWPSPEEPGTAILTPEMAHVLDARDDAIDLSCNSSDHGFCVSLATDFLEKSGGLLVAEPRTGSFCVKEIYLKRGQVDDAIDRAFTWLNAKVRVQESCETHAVYHTWWFHAQLASEDHWETHFPITLNSQSNAQIEMPDTLDLWELEPNENGDEPMASTFEHALRIAQREIKQQSCGFVARMDGRLERDRKRLREYYGALTKETTQKQRRGSKQVEPEQVEEKKLIVKLELQRKLAELDGRYAMDAQLTPIVLVLVDLPVLEVEIIVYRKKAKRTHLLTWNPLIKQFEPLACTNCGRSTHAVAFTNVDVEPLCAACAR